jgi:hypothetical protein
MDAVPAALATLALAVAMTGVHDARAQATGTAIEYHHAGFDHYFTTADPREIAALDGGAFGGAWVRTGLAFDVWMQPGPGLAPTCRYFSAAFAPRSTHFYSSLPGECSSLMDGSLWQYEGTAFWLRMPDMMGRCPTGSAPLYRMYNDGHDGAPNHRYTSSGAAMQHMHDQGWVAEGHGAMHAFACVPATGP